MATWAIGDLQGCHDQFLQLLQRIDFKPDRDQLWLAGDLVNRGPASLETLRACFDRRDNVTAVLGNHDLHLLAVMAGAATPRRKDTLEPVLSAPDRDRLETWLLSCPLLAENETHLLCHAGIYPLWDLETARRCAREVEAALANPASRQQYFDNMYGNEPAHWNESWTGVERWRTITNMYTRMRLLDQSAALDLEFKETVAAAPAHLTPWFEWPQRTRLPKRILFGHWAALEGRVSNTDVIALDTGCVWGGSLTAYCLESEALISCQC